MMTIDMMHLAAKHLRDYARTLTSEDGYGEIYRLAVNLESLADLLGVMRQGPGPSMPGATAAGTVGCSSADRDRELGERLHDFAHRLNTRLPEDARARVLWDESGGLARPTRVALVRDVADYILRLAGQAPVRPAVW